MHNAALSAAKILLIAVLTLSISGCEEDPKPFLGTDEPFTVYGYLNPKSDRQLARVIPLAGSIDEIGVGADQATVRTTNLATGEMRVWKDSVVTFADESTAIVFFSDFTPPHETSYRLEVIRTDGATSSVEVTTPKDISITRVPDSDPLTPRFFLEGALPNLVEARIKYDTYALQPQAPIAIDPVLFPTQVSYKEEAEQVNGGWEFQVSHRNDYFDIQEAFEESCFSKEFIAVLRIRFDFFVGDDGWVPPGGEFDPELLVSPNLFSNIENGFGYFGAGYPVSFNILPSTPVMEQAGFTFTPPCRPFDQLPVDHPDCQVFPGCIDGTMGNQALSEKSEIN